MVRIGTALLLSAAACAEDLKSTDNGDNAGASAFSVQTSVKGNGLRETTVNASDMVEYKYFDLDKAAEVDADDAGWDLAFLRFKIKTNGGDSGDADVVVAKLESTSFDELSQAPSEGYVQDSDKVSRESEGGDPNFGFLGPKPWYGYTTSNHQLTPADYVYVVRSTKHEFYKVQMLGYYDKAGTAGYPRFQWKKLELPSSEIKVEEQAGEAPDAGATTDEPRDAGSMDKPAGATAAFGCYNQKVHLCDCKTDQAACESAMGIWAAQCACDTK